MHATRLGAYLQSISKLSWDSNPASQDESQGLYRLGYALMLVIADVTFFDKKCFCVWFVSSCGECFPYCKLDVWPVVHLDFWVLDFFDHLSEGHRHVDPALGDAAEVDGQVSAGRRLLVENDDKVVVGAVGRVLEELQLRNNNILAPCLTVRIFQADFQLGGVF